MRHQHANSFTVKTKEKEDPEWDEADTVSWFLPLLNEVGRNEKFPFWQWFDAAWSHNFWELVNLCLLWSHFLCVLKLWLIYAVHVTALADFQQLDFKTQNSVEFPHVITACLFHFCVLGLIPIENRNISLNLVAFLVSQKREYCLLYVI